MFSFFSRCSPVCLYLIIATLNLGCEDLPQRDFEDFKKRTASIRAAGQEEAPPAPSKLADIRGMWLLNARLNAGIDLGLRVLITSGEVADDEALPTKDGQIEAPLSLLAKIWLERQDPATEPPLVLVKPDPVIDEEGRFILTADPLILDASSSSSSTNVEAIVHLESQIIDGDTFCGVASGSVTVPFMLDLMGSRFYAARDDEGALTLADLPARCPSIEQDSSGGIEGEGIDAGESEGGILDGPGGAEAMAGALAGAEPVRPASPDLSAIESRQADLSGHWLVNILLPNELPLKLWISMIYTAPISTEESPDGELAHLDGLIRRELDPIGAPAIATFSIPVSPEGAFEIWLPDFVLDGLLRVEADLFISGVTLAMESAVEGEEPITQGWCGAAAGEVRSPFPLDLEGTTLYAHPWTPGDPAPIPLYDSCPDP